MPRPSERTRSRVRVTKPLPGGKTGTQFKGEIGALSRCSRCGQQLAGISSSNPLKSRKSDLSRKKVWRIYGGQLCHSCLKTALRQSAREL